MLKWVFIRSDAQINAIMKYHLISSFGQDQKIPSCVMCILGRWAYGETITPINSHWSRNWSNLQTGQFGNSYHILKYSYLCLSSFISRTVSSFGHICPFAKWCVWKIVYCSIVWTSTKTPQNLGITYKSIKRGLAESNYGTSLYRVLLSSKNESLFICWHMAI